MHLGYYVRKLEANATKNCINVVKARHMLYERNGNLLRKNNLDKSYILACCLLIYLSDTKLDDFLHDTCIYICQHYREGHISIKKVQLILFLSIRFCLRPFKHCPLQSKL